jgi:dTDP-glucose pyrophosphorylase
MMNILIPMAGRGSRFSDAGYVLPKPLIDVNGQPMIKVVVDNIGLKGHYIFLVLKEHDDRYGVTAKLHEMCGCNPTTVILVDQVTQGAACTALLARDEIDNKNPLLIANSDQLVNWSPAHFKKYMKKEKADGGILTFLSDDPKWSFAKVDYLTNRITEVVEKKVISNIATVGVYYFGKGSDFVSAADEMISKNTRVNGEFYVAPTYNEMIAAGKKVLNYPIVGMQGLGTPADLEIFLKGE